MKRWALWLGPLAAALVAGTLYHRGFPAEACWTAAITLLTACWWVFEPIPIPAASLIPLALFPLVGVLTPQQVGAAYGDPMILLLTGGFMLSVAMERSGTHRRLALEMVRFLGGSSARRLVLGFLVASAALSMWISNAATSLMLLPIVLAVAEKVPDRRLCVALLLAVAYGASLGGIGTPVGTPPNLIFMQKFAAATGQEVGFVTWMCWAVPIMCAMIPLAWLWLIRGIRSVARIELPEVGAWRSAEIRTLTVFTVTACLWVTRTAPWGGWREWLAVPQANDASVALLAVVAMFLIPDGHGQGERLLDWKSAGRIPWGVLLLFSSGIVIAEAFSRSGLSQAVGEELAALAHLPTFLMLVLLCLVVTFLTEVTSNTAIANLLLPMLAAAAQVSGLDYRLLMVPATITASFAFMLPVATAPNAVVFSSEQITVREMAREGLALNLIGVVVVSTHCWWLFG